VELAQKFGQKCMITRTPINLLKMEEKMNFKFNKFCTLYQKAKAIVLKTQTQVTGILLLGLSYSPSVFAASDPFSTAGNQATQIGDKFKVFGLIFAGAFILVLSVVQMMPFKAAKDWVKKHLGALLLGIAGLGLGGAFIGWVIQLTAQ
jgi:hypothetical protein